MWKTIESVPRDEAVLIAGGDISYPIVASWSGLHDEAWRLDAQMDTHDEIDGWPAFWMSLDDLPDLPKPQR